MGGGHDLKEKGRRRGRGGYGLEEEDVVRGGFLCGFSMSHSFVSSFHEEKKSEVNW